MAHAVHCSRIFILLLSDCSLLLRGCLCYGGTGILVFTEIAFSQFCSWKKCSGSGFSEMVVFDSQAGCSFNPSSGSPAATFSHLVICISFITALVLLQISYKCDS